jgi:DNA-binding IclR family transcriptional regulator
VAIPRRAADAPYAISVTLLKARAEDSRRDALAADLRRLARLLSHPLAPGDDAGTRAEP